MLSQKTEAEVRLRTAIRDLWNEIVYGPDAPPHALSSATARAHASGDGDKIALAESAEKEMMKHIEWIVKDAAARAPTELRNTGGINRPGRNDGWVY